MRELTLGGIHDDSDHLVLLSSDGERYLLRIDEALRGAVRRDRPAVHTARGDSERSLTPKEIQALLRAGHSVESIAQSSGVHEARIRRFEGPILAERAHMARQGQAYRIGRGSSSVLSDVVAARLSARDVQGEPEWDAWRRPDGSWTLHVQFTAGSRLRSATWHMDVQAHLIHAEDDEARWLSDPSDDEASRPRMSTVRTSVFDVEAHGFDDRAQGRTPIRESDIDELNARRGVRPHDVYERPDSASGVSSTSPWISIDSAANEPQHDASNPVQPHHDHERPRMFTRHDFVSTEEVEYVHAPDDLDEAMRAEAFSDPAHDPHASQEPYRDRDSDDDQGAEADPVDESDGPSSTHGDQQGPRTRATETTVNVEDLTPLPGFDSVPQAEQKKKKKTRASIPSWDDIVFGSRDR